MSKSSEKHSHSVLDAVLSDSGAMPAARLGIRLQAFVLDCIFITLFSFIVIGQFALPRAFPNALTEMNAWNEEFTEWFSGLAKKSDSSESKPMPQLSQSLEDAMIYVQMLALLFFWLYFTIGEAFFSGYTFGKSICRLRTISVITMQKPFFFSTVVRAGIKSFAVLSPFILFATVIFLKFNKRRQMGHDLLCHTAVVDERYLSSVDQIR